MDRVRHVRAHSIPLGTNHRVLVLQARDACVYTLTRMQVRHVAVPSWQWEYEAYDAEKARAELDRHKEKVAKSRCVRAYARVRVRPCACVRE